MTDLSPRQRIRTEIINWFDKLDTGFIVTTDDCARHVNRYLDHKEPMETIKRYMRELRSDGTIKYVFIGPKNKKSIRVVK